ncbi:MAG: heimdallarchaeosortase [Candidatus Odinarchaeota archaeon]
MVSEPASNISSTTIIQKDALLKKTPSKDQAEMTEVERRKPEFDGQWIITSFILVCITSITIYVAFDYVIIEQVTAEIVAVILTALGYPSSLTHWENALGIPTGEWAFLNEATPRTPGVVIAGVEDGPFWIVKACTGMQAGAILLSLIVFTKRKDESFFNRESLRTKAGVFIVFYIVLFVANAIRIAFHLWLVALPPYTLPTSIINTFPEWFPEGRIPFEIAHDALSKPIGFLGTLIFAWIIEKMGVPIIDTFADWLDYSWYQCSRLLRAVGL